MHLLLTKMYWYYFSMGPTYNIEHLNPITDCKFGSVKYHTSGRESHISNTLGIHHQIK